MPELPEVETVRNTLKPLVIGKKIMNVKIYHENIIAYPKASEFIELVKNQTINDIGRIGKFLIFILDDYFLLSHLRMEGKYFIKTNELKTKHEHVIFSFDTGEELRYHDTRKFGKMDLIKKEDYNSYKKITDLGYEPWEEEMTVEYLYGKLKNKSIPIKTALLDQKIILGLGNIYVNEVLFLAGISPFMPSKEITSNQVAEVIEISKKVLDKAIELGGTTIHSFSSGDGITGRFQNELTIHGKKDEQCINCGTIIKKDYVNGRGTYYCSRCQGVKK